VPGAPDLSVVAEDVVQVTEHGDAPCSRVTGFGGSVPGRCAPAPTSSRDRDRIRNPDELGYRGAGVSVCAFDQALILHQASISFRFQDRNRHHRGHMSERLRIGIAGAGLIAARAHVPALLGCADAQFAALVDTDIERARDLAARSGQTPRVATDVQDVLDRVDAMIIATPNHSHRNLAVRCLEAGVHVLIEKPLATSAAEAEAIVAAAHRSGKIAAVGYNRRFLNAVPLMKELLDSGYFGELRRFAYHSGRAGGWSPVSAYNLRRQSAGGGVLTVEGCHFLDRLIYWFGVPDSCACFDDSQGGPEATVVCRFGYRKGGSGLQGEARLSKTTPWPRTEGFALETARGVVIFREQDDHLLFHQSARPRRELQFGSCADARSPKAGTFALQLEDFVSACLTGRPPRVPVADGLTTQRLIDELYAVRQPLAQASVRAPGRQLVQT
jgi:predicted dehydrogenase